jgi:hypothetical protein
MISSEHKLTQDSPGRNYDLIQYNDNCRSIATRNDLSLLELYVYLILPCTINLPLTPFYFVMVLFASPVSVTASPHPATSS